MEVINEAELKIEYLPVDDIMPYEDNAREHHEWDVLAIANSIKEFGFDDPIGIWGDENVIVEGHGRLLAAKQLGMEKVPVIRLDHLTEEQRRAYALAHNKTAELSEWDMELLSGELNAIINIDMEMFGFDLGVDEKVKEKEEENGDVPFTEVLGEEHNYLVLYFDNEVDWLQAESLFDIKEVKNLSTRKDGVVKANMQRRGIGRVLKGNVALEKLREHYEHQH